ncbi:2-methylcitrate dehydratase PrpD [Rhizobium tibeticum]|nr:hypothetical protein [Rhizobium tibeticum]MDP9813367.1 2-methylcitrate dehydratase PrpD [Rhizobium tibeticum]
MALGIAVGIDLGAVIGTARHDISIGTAIGIAIGAAVGALRHSI